MTTTYFLFFPFPLFSSVLFFFFFLISFRILPCRIFSNCIPGTRYCIFGFYDQLKQGCPGIATAYCTDLSSSSYPLEMTSRWSIRYLEKFTKLFNLKEPIYLHTKKIDNVFYWMTIGIEIEGIEKSENCGETLSFFNGKLTCEPFENYIIICEKACDIVWKREKIIYLGGQLVPRVKTLEKCKEACERTSKCIGITFDRTSRERICFYISIKNISKRRSTEIFSMSVKREKEIYCLSDVKDSPPSYLGNCNWTVPANLLADVSLVMKILLSIVAMAIVVNVVHQACLAIFAYIELKRINSKDQKREMQFNY